MELNRSVQLTLDRGVARLRLVAAESDNALDGAMMADLLGGLDRALADPELRAVVVEAEGPTFCSGLALEAAYVDGKANREAIASFEKVLSILADAPVVSIACVDGPASGGGVGLAAACDLVLATPRARFVLPEARRGLIPATIAPFLMRRVSPARFRALALSMRTIGLQEAFAIGLVDEVVADALDDALARQLHAIRRAKAEALAEIKALVTNPDPPGRGGERLAAWLERPDILACLG
jgi:methylglutaconyl-CoA hydratase/polyketide biosynthesis enoyl-CoA hydratase PksH